MKIISAFVIGIVILSSMSYGHQPILDNKYKWTIYSPDGKVMMTDCTELATRDNCFYNKDGKLVKFKCLYYQVGQ